MVDIKDEKLAKLRKQIDKLDNQLLDILEKRFKLVEKVAERKKEKGLPIRDLAREDDVINSKCEKTTLPKGTVKKLYRFLIDEAIKVEVGK